MSSLKKNIYIDAIALLPKNKSGIGYALEQTLNSLIKENKISKNYTIYLVVPLGKSKLLKDYISQTVKVKTIYIPARVFNYMVRFFLFPPADWLLGNGIYIFPNYRNWTLWKSRSLTYVYDTSFIKYPEMVQPKNQKYLSKYIKRWTARADKILTITETVKDELEKELNIPYPKIDVVYCGVDSELFYRRSEKVINETLKKYEIPFEDYFIFVGNIEPRKNLINLLEAYIQLPAKTRDKYGLLIIGGDGWLNDEFIQRLNLLISSGYRIFRPKIYINTKDLPAFYSGAKLLIHPAVYEGFGITPLEAAACETAVVSSDIQAIEEVMNATVLYFNPTDPSSITHSITRSLEDTEGTKRRIIAAKQRADNFTWEASAKVLLDTINTEIKIGSPPHQFLQKIKRIYSTSDLKIRSLLNDTAKSAYRPLLTNDENTLRTAIFNDYLSEQPSFIQYFLLKIYLSTKHVLAVSLRRAYKVVRK